MLDVCQKQADVGRDARDVFIRHVQRRLDCSVNTFRTAHMQYFGKEVRKQQAFAAGKSHAAAGLRIVVTVLLDFPHQPFERILLPAQRERLIWADLGAPGPQSRQFSRKYTCALSRTTCRWGQIATHRPQPMHLLS